MKFDQSPISWGGIFKAYFVVASLGLCVTANTLAADIPWHGWSSGVSGEGSADGSFQTWRGSPVTAIGTWADSTQEAQIQLDSLGGEYANWDGDVDIAIGGTDLELDQSYAQAAAGDFDQWWIDQATNLQRLRGSKKGLTFVRPFHEFNGSWYAHWFVTAENVEDYKSAFRRRVEIIRREFPRAVIVWSPNDGSSGNAAPIEQAYPGDDVVDVIGVDSYNANGNPVVTDAAKWDEYANRGTADQPAGVEMWRQFAEKHGKPMSLPEWGLRQDGGGGDNPEYIRGMHDWIASHAATPGDRNVAGKIVYDVYFNVRLFRPALISGD